MISTQEVKEITKKFGQTATDTGSPEVQVAYLTKRIANLAPHFDKHIHDHHSKRGLMKLIGQRKSLLRYLMKKDVSRYQNIIQKLGLRK